MGGLALKDHQTPPRPCRLDEKLRLFRGRSGRHRSLLDRLSYQLPGGYALQCLPWAQSATGIRYGRIEAAGPLPHTWRVPRQRQQIPKAKKKNPAEAGLSEGENRLPASSLNIQADQASPQTSCAVSITRRSLVRWASTAMLLPWTVLEKPH